MLKTFVNCLVALLPWKLKRLVLVRLYHYDIHPTARIGLSYIFPKHLTMEEGATIGHLNVAIHLELIHMGKDCTICQRNWITGFPLADKSHFEEFTERKPYLIMGKDSAITKQHLVDCTDTVTIGELTSVGGYGTQILSHSTSLQHNRQSCAPISIGHHCFVGTRCIILPGAILPPRCALGAGAVLKKAYTEELCLYGGIPARFIKKIDGTYAFFSRTHRPR